MPALSRNRAAEQLAIVVAQAKPAELVEIQAELFPGNPTAPLRSALDLAQHIRSGLAAEEVVDLWNVVFPADRNVWYDEEDDRIHFNEEALGYAETD